MALHLVFRSNLSNALFTDFRLGRMKLLSMMVLTFVALNLSARESLAQIVPYKTMGTGSYFSPITGDYSGLGVGTHMGRHTFLGNIAVTPTANPLLFGFQSTAPQETLAADGSKLFFNVSGQVELVPINPPIFSARWKGQFVVAGGTGRFANVNPAAQPLQIIAINHPFNILTDPFWKFDWEVNGQIDLR